jgi:cytochrome c553
MNRLVKMMLGAAACMLAVMPGLLPAPALAADAAPYKVVEGHKVDGQTLSGWHTWRALACERCHGAAQENIDNLYAYLKGRSDGAIQPGRLQEIGK